MATLQELLAQRAEIEKLIAETHREERTAAIAKVRALMDEHGLTVADLGGKGPSTRSSKSTGAKVAPKYRNGIGGETWSGRGLQPKWLKAALADGKKLTDFAV